MKLQLVLFYSPLIIGSGYILYRIRKYFNQPENRSKNKPDIECDIECEVIKNTPIEITTKRTEPNPIEIDYVELESDEDF